MPIIRLLAPGEVPVALLSTTELPKVPAETPVIGTSTYAARADHVHPEQELSPLSMINPLPAGTASPGISLNVSREDHVHEGQPIPNITPFAESILDDSDATSVRATIGSVGTTGNETVSGSKTFSDIIIPNSIKGIKGTTTNDNAQAGSIGELVSSQILVGNRITLTNAAQVNLTSITLTAGHWNVSMNAYFYAVASGAVVNRIAFSVGEVSATFNLDNGLWQLYPSNLTTGSAGVFYSGSYISVPYQRSSSFTLYAVVHSGFSAGSVQSYGSIFATRVR